MSGNGLAQEDRDAISRAAEKSYQTLGSVMDASFDAQLEELRKAGANVRVLGADEVEKFEASSQYQNVQSAWVKEQESKGVANAGQAMADIASIMNDTMK
jgi:hypothetical protein